MPRFYEPDLTVDPNSPFVRDAGGKLVRRSYWMDDQTLVMVVELARTSRTTRNERILSTSAGRQPEAA
jgi:hypothetical protein